MHASSVRWMDDGENTSFIVTSDGRSGPQWIKCLGENIGEETKEVLNSADFDVSRNTRTHIMIFSGKAINTDLGCVGRDYGNNLYPEVIYNRACILGLEIPTLEVACLVYEKLLMKEIHIKNFRDGIFTLHRQFQLGDSTGYRHGLYSAMKNNKITASYKWHNYPWNVCTGFVFAF